MASLAWVSVISMLQRAFKPQCLEKAWEYVRNDCAECLSRAPANMRREEEARIAQLTGQPRCVQAAELCP